MKTLNMILVASVVTASAALAGEGAPKGWFLAGSSPKDYKTSVDTNMTRSGKTSACLKSVVATPAGFGTMMQTIKADSYRGKRVRMSGYVRSDGVTDWAGLWMRVDGPKGEPMAFDNMQNRAIKGTGDWSKYDVVLDVPADAKEIAFGVLLSGTGQVWINDLSFESVGNDVAVTGTGATRELPKKPKLDFEK